jgi:glutamate/tyrosine decarboxylase-like PLP-dependent enzyme
MNKTEVRLPRKGKSKTEVLKEMRAFARGDADYRGAKTWSLVYYLDDEHTKFLHEAYGLFFSENALNPMAFLSLKRMEAEVVRMTAGLLRGDRNVVGTMTSGGTESCLLAVKTARDRARRRKRWLKPEMIVPASVHVAFRKAAEYFGVKAVYAPLDKNYRVDARAVKKLISRNTVLIVGSAPSYPHGMIDPIEDLARLAKRRGIPLHVDSCLGGFLLPFVEKLGYPIPPFDFRVPGVTSMSADVHKYGYAAKGASVILYRDMDHLKRQFFICDDWPGGVFASPALLGTRPGGAIAAAWAAMQALGEDGYLKAAKAAMETTRRLIDGIQAIPPLRVIARPPMSVFAYQSTSPELSIFAVGDQMEKRGWHIDRVQRPDGLHAMVTPRHAMVVDQYLADLRESVDEVRRHPELAERGGAAMYGIIAHIPLRGMIRNEMMKMMEDMYGPDGQMPPLTEGPPDDLATKAGLLFLRLRKELAKKLERKS